MWLDGDPQRVFNPAKNGTHRRDAEDAEVTFLLFSFERKENNNYKPNGDTTILSKFTLLVEVRLIKL